MSIKITTLVKATVDLTPTQWELFTFKTDCDAAASALNARLNELIAAYPERTQESANAVGCGMREVMGRYSSVGASDSEPRYTVDSIIKQVYGYEV